MSTEQPVADFTSHHIEGYARAALESGQDGFFSAPLVSHIEGNLYVGGCIGGVRLGDDFRHVISLYPWERYTLGPTTELTEVRLYDAAEIPDEEQLYDLAAKVNACLAEGKTLVHCQAGLNRSNLIAGLALILAGRAPADAIALLRERRHPVVLCNSAFEGWLLQQEAAS